ncbi:hypothetical protein PIB30_113794, partial [Stylosanthes scabra]|nr:hypothetical protein [Stylosanthes scabra]
MGCVRTFNQVHVVPNAGGDGTSFLLAAHAWVRMDRGPIPLGPQAPIRDWRELRPINTENGVHAVHR